MPHRRGDPYIVWRTIKEFPDYEMNRFGDVREKRTGKQKTKHYNGAYYYAFRKEGKNYTRGLRPLFATTFPELDPNI